MFVCVLLFVWMACHVRPCNARLLGGGETAVCNLPNYFRYPQKGYYSQFVKHCCYELDTQMPSGADLIADANTLSV